jgi:pimeloyl-ACP methyl ester carboxylesterase
MRKFLKWLLIIILSLFIAGLALGWQSDRDSAEMRAKYSNNASQFIDLGAGLKVHARDEGKRDGPTLLLIHGSNASLHTWEPWVKRLGGKYRVISLDLPGHGLTGENPSRDYSYAAFVDVTDRAMSKLGIGKFAIAGNSMGGAVAWHYALAHPEKATALGLIDAAGAPASQSKALPLGFKLARNPIARGLMRYVTPRFVIEKSLHQSVGNQAIVTDAMVDRYWELLLYPGNRAATLDRFARDNRSEAATKAALAAIKVPTLIMWGEDDSLIPVSSAAWFGSAIAGSKTIIYPGIGHIPMEEAADKSAADIDAFLSAIPQPE